MLALGHTLKQPHLYAELVARNSLHQDMHRVSHRNDVSCREVLARHIKIYRYSYLFYCSAQLDDWSLEQIVLSHFEFPYRPRTHELVEQVELI